MGIIMPNEELIKEKLQRKEEAKRIANIKFGELMHDLDIILQKHNAVIQGACCELEYVIMVDGFNFTFYKD